MINTPDSFSLGLGFKTLPGDSLSPLKRFMVFLSPSMQIPGKDVNYATTVSFDILSN
jgi:hypothetical protein